MGELGLFSLSRKESCEESSNEAAVCFWVGSGGGEDRDQGHVKVEL